METEDVTVCCSFSGKSCCVLHQVAISAVAGILKQLKRPKKKVAVKPSTIGENETHKRTQIFSPQLLLGEQMLITAMNTRCITLYFSNIGAFSH